MMTTLAAHPEKTVFQSAALQEVAKLLLYILRQGSVLGGKLCCVTRTGAGESLLRTQAARVLTMRTLISGEPAQALHTGERQLIGSDA